MENKLTEVSGSKVCLLAIKGGFNKDFKGLLNLILKYYISSVCIIVVCNASIIEVNSENSYNLFNKI